MRDDRPAPVSISVGSEPVAWTTRGNLETLASTPKEARYMWGLPSGSTISVPLYASPQAPAERVVGGGLTLISAERERQIAKGYDSAHDDRHNGGELVMADWGARARIEAAINAGRSGDVQAYKELLVEAAAQCLAEIERVKRAEVKANG